MQRNAPRGGVEVVAGSRLHFGLFSFGKRAAREYGGLGVMVESPQVAVRVVPSDCLDCAGPRSGRAREFAGLWKESVGFEAELPCRIQVDACPVDHIGLGTGTQLALAVGAALSRFFEVRTPAPAELSRRMRRAERSAVGTYGFEYGGLVVEAGRGGQDALSPLLANIKLPESWRWVLLCPGEAAQAQARGLFGQAEQSAFDALPAVPEEIRERLLREALDHLAPAAQSGDFAAFAESVFRYGYEAGLCFAEQQGGAFASRRLAKIVDMLRGWGVRGVGQSSWGPTLFAACPTEESAHELADKLRREPATSDLEIIVTATRNRGASIRAAAP